MNLTLREIEKLRDAGVLPVVLDKGLGIKDAGYEFGDAKEKRIAFLSLFRTLSNQVDEMSPKKIKKIEKYSNDLVERLFEKYKPSWYHTRTNSSERIKKEVKKVKKEK